MCYYMFYIIGFYAKIFKEKTTFILLYEIQVIVYLEINTMLIFCEQTDFFALLIQFV